MVTSVRFSNKNLFPILRSFNQHINIVSKLEQHVGSIGKRFLFENLTDVTIADDKLRHTSKTFSDHVLQRTGFRGSRCGPVMIGAGSVQHGLIRAIYFSRKGDSALSATDGAVYNAMATMEFKYKSVLPNIPSNIVCKVGNASQYFVVAKRQVPTMQCPPGDPRPGSAKSPRACARCIYRHPRTF
jgi:hypothetical protein